MTGKDLLAMLPDEGSFIELDGGHRCGLLTGMCTLDARPLCIAAPSTDKENASEEQMRLMHLLDMALKIGAPVVMIPAGNEAVFQDGRVMRHMARLSGVCPMIALMQTQMQGLVSAAAALCDLRIHIACEGATAGCNDLCAADEVAAVEMLRNVLSLLPSNCAEDAPLLDIGDDLMRLSETQECATAAQLARMLSDSESYLPLFADRYGEAALARTAGRTVGMISLHEDRPLRGMARFVQFCDSFSLPLVYVLDDKFPLQDAQLTYAAAAATVPQVIVLREGGEAPSFMDVVLASRQSANCVQADHAAAMRDFRRSLTETMELLSGKRENGLPPRKHGNMPL